MIGAEGTLGIITELTLRLSGIPEAISSGICPFPSVEAACNATIMTIQSGIPVARIELLDALQVRACNAYSKLTLPETPMLFLEFHGTAAGVAEQSRALRRNRPANSAAGRSIGRRAPRSAPGCGRRGMTLIGRSAGCGPAPSRSRPTSACRSRGSPNASRETQRDVAESRLVAPIVGHVGDGNFHLRDDGRPRRCRMRWRAPRHFSIGWSSARWRWTAPAPANTASVRAK